MPFTYRQRQLLINQLVLIVLRSHFCLKNTQITTRQQEQIADTVKWMHAHEDIGVHDAASHAFLSPSHFRRLFQQYMGINPQDYLMNLRLQNAKSLLLQTELPLTQIAAMSGYHTPQHFSRTFRKLTGSSPSDWRKAQLLEYPIGALYGDEEGE